MAVDLIGGGADPAAVIATMPMAGKGAMRENRAVEAFREGEVDLSQLSQNRPRKPQPGADVRKQRKPVARAHALVQKEVALLVQWIKFALGQDIFDSGQSIRERLDAMKPDIRKKMQAFYQRDSM